MKRFACAIIGIVVLFGSALYATSFVSAEGEVHSVWVTVSGITYLKIERPDGSKVAADCHFTDAILNECQRSTPGDPAAGFARCDGGFCTWLTLEVENGEPGNGPGGGG